MPTGGIRTRTSGIMIPAFVTPTGGTGLRTDMVSYWEFENTSWVDSHGTNTLTGTNSPTSTNTAPAVIGNYVNLVAASSQKLAVASNATLQIGGDDWSIALWAFIATGAADGAVAVSKYGAFGNREFKIRVSFGTGFQFDFHPITNSGATDNSLKASTFGNLTLDTWYFVACTYTNSTNTARISVNAGTQDSLVVTNPPIADSTADFAFGTDDGSDPFWNGRLDQCGFWKDRVLSTGDISLLYNGGAGLSYAGTA